MRTMHAAVAVARIDGVAVLGGVMLVILLRMVLVVWLVSRLQLLFGAQFLLLQLEPALAGAERAENDSLIRLTLKRMYRLLTSHF